MMKRQSDGDVSHILVMPNGGRSSTTKPRKFEVGNGTLRVQFGIETACQSA